MNTHTNTPRLLKERMRYTTYFALALIPLIIFQVGVVRETIWLRAAMLGLGYPLVIAAAFGRAYCSLFIGGRKNDEVVRMGPYSIVRNPLYVFSFLGIVGIGLQSASPLLLCILIGAFVYYYPMVVEHEEAFLANKFGESYQAFLREVPRWIPKFSLWNAPEMVEANPGRVLKTMLDASVFLLPLVGFQLIELVRHTL